MAANAIAMRNALDRIGFSAAAAAAIVNEQGIDQIEEMIILTDAEVENLCKVVRRPGGQQGQGQNAHQVSMRAENNLKLACYWGRHQERVSRTAEPNNITLQQIRALRHLRDAETNHEDPEEAPSIISSNWARTLEALEEYLRGFLGTTKVPLSYVVRENQEVLAEADDPPFGDPDSNYTTIEEEMIARAPHLNAHDVPEDTFVTDRQRVWDLIAGITREHECWTHVRPAQRTRDGRMAFRRLWDHFLGPNNVDNSILTIQPMLQKGSCKRSATPVNARGGISKSMFEPTLISTKSLRGWFAMVMQELMSAPRSVTLWMVSRPML